MHELGLNLYPSQVEAIKCSLKKKGVSIIGGEYGSGKTSLVAPIAYSLLWASENEIERQKQMKLANSRNKTYSIKELMNEHDSDEDMYDYGVGDQKVIANTQNPWSAQGYTNLFDEISYKDQKR